MSAILDFLTEKGTDHRSRNFKDILRWGDFYLERGHDYIQWLFPSDIPSEHFEGAPILTKEDMAEMAGNEYFASTELIHFNIRSAYVRFMTFYFQWDWSTPKSDWLTPHNHNYKRLTRILRCLWICGMKHEYDLLMKTLEGVYLNHSRVIGETTLNFWRSANKDL